MYKNTQVNTKTKKKSKKMKEQQIHCNGGSLTHSEHKLTHLHQSRKQICSKFVLIANNYIYADTSFMPREWRANE